MQIRVTLFGQAVLEKSQEGVAVTTPREKSNNCFQAGSSSREPCLIRQIPKSLSILLVHIPIERFILRLQFMTFPKVAVTRAPKGAISMSGAGSQ